MFGNGRAFQLFKILGIPIKVELSWALMAGYLIFFLGQSISSDISSKFPGSMNDYPYIGYLAGFGMVILLYASLLAHELSHSLLARRFGAEVKQIQLSMLGGMSVIDKEEKYDRPKRQFLVAFVGPLASFLLAVVFLGLAFTFLSSSKNPYIFIAGDIAQYLAVLNGMIGVFNLIPAFPLDGGRVLLATLRGFKMPSEKAMNIVFAVSNVCSFMMVLGGITLVFFSLIWNGVFLCGIGIFLFMGVRREKSVERSKTIKVKEVYRQFSDFERHVFEKNVPEAVIAGIPLALLHMRTCDEESTLREVFEELERADTLFVKSGEKVVGTISMYQVERAMEARRF